MLILEYSLSLYYNYINPIKTITCLTLKFIVLNPFEATVFK